MSDEFPTWGAPDTGLLWATPPPEPGLRGRLRRVWKRHPKRLAFLLVVLVLVSLWGWAAATAPPPVSMSAWRACGSFECAELSVPIDWDQPSGRHVSIALERLPASDRSAREGSILLNPGGPGASGVDFLTRDAARFSSELRAHFDLVGFDPRGIGASVPDGCDPKWGAYVYEPRSCSAQMAAHMGSRDVARDMEAIRATALREDRLNYFGFSYGTLLGALYADSYPDRVGAMVLDGPVDPALDLTTQTSDQVVAGEGELRKFLSQCGGDPACPFYSEGEAADAYERLIAQASPDDRPFLEQAVFEGLYSDDAGRAHLARALASWQQTGDPGALGSVADKQQDNGGYVFCADMPTRVGSTPDTDTWTANVKANAPDFWEEAVLIRTTCASRPFRVANTLGPLHAHGAPTILVIAATGDPATPYKWGQSLAAQLESAVLLTRNGSGHTSYTFSACVRDAVDRYLVGHQPPPAGTTCD